MAAEAALGAPAAGLAGAARWIAGEGGASPGHAAAGGCEALLDGTLHDEDELRRLLPGPAAPAALVLAAYRRWGEEALGRLRGAYALVLWDRERGLLLAARDPLGLHPLFYAEAGRELLLSSSIEALAGHPRVSRAVNRAALADHLRHRWPVLEETYYEAVRRVPPGHVLRISREGTHVRRYWQPAPAGEPVRWVREDEAGRFGELLARAVDRCLRPGPAGIFLSGGLDSVSVAIQAAEVCRGANLPAPWALSLVFPEPACEEQTQHQVAAALGLPQVIETVAAAIGGGSLLTAALEMSARRPAPLLNLWAPAYRHLGRAGRERGCRVILTGNGGDEWLEVSPYYAADLLRRLDVPGLGRLWSSMQRSYPLSRQVAGNVLWRYGARPLLRRRALRMAERLAPRGLARHRRRRFAAAEPRWLAPEDELARELYRRAEAARVAQGVDGFYLGEVRRVLDLPIQALDMEEISESGREMGVRLLHPYWDADLVDFLHRTPPELLVQDQRSKSPARRLVERRLPELGFKHHRKLTAMDFFRTVLVRDGLAAWRALAKDLALARLGIADARGLDEHVVRLCAGGGPREVLQIWYILSAEAWLQGHVPR
jgi:asparagine synthase (glutamine-hydrolysing)